MPSKAQQAAAGTKAKLDTLLKDVDYANFAMDKWMKEFKFDIEKEFPDIKARIDYLKSEEIKVDKMKESIDYSLNRADTVLKKTFLNAYRSHPKLGEMVEAVFIEQPYILIKIQIPIERVAGCQQGFFFEHLKKINKFLMQAADGGLYCFITQWFWICRQQWVFYIFCKRLF